MRITYDLLMKNAQDLVARRVREDRGIIAVFLCGSMLGEEYLLGGTTDIDLVFIHTDVVSLEREVVRLTDDVHLDIAHHLHKEYRQPRRLRVHPWMGPTLNACRGMHDPQHFLDFTQASVRGQFDRPDHVLERVHKQVEMARQIWLSYVRESVLPEPQDISAYLRAVEHAANAIASLNGLPLTERRFLLQFPARCAALGRPGLAAGLLGLLGAPRLEAGSLAGWLLAWQATYESPVDEKHPVRLHPARLAYYRKAFDAILASEQPQAVLWPLLRTWTQLAATLAEDSPLREDWRQALQQLGLMGAGFDERIAALDAYLDLVDETVEVWGRENGA